MNAVGISARTSLIVFFLLHYLFATTKLPFIQESETVSENPILTPIVKVPETKKVPKVNTTKTFKQLHLNSRTPHIVSRRNERHDYSKEPRVTKFTLSQVSDGITESEEDLMRLFPLFASTLGADVIPTSVSREHPRKVISGQPSVRHPQKLVPISYAEMFQRPKLDMKNISILLFFKIGLTKLKLFMLLKFLFIILLKFKLALAIMFAKFLFFLKTIHLLKKLLPLLLLPMLAPLLLLLLPLLLLPLLLLPLILLIPVPVPAAQFSHRILFSNKQNGRDVYKHIYHQLLQSEKCVERVACQLATRDESRIFSPILNWYLKILRKFVTNKRILSYINAFLRTNKEFTRGKVEENDGQEWCSMKFKCSQNRNKHKASTSSSRN